MQLVTPCLELTPSYIAALREGQFSPMQLSFGRATPEEIEKDPLAYVTLLNQAAPFDVNLPDHPFRVTAHEILWIAQETRFLGAVALRYDAAPNVLGDYAGHIGMAMRPLLINRGMGARAIRQGLGVLAEKFQNKGLTSILAICNAQNPASRRLIEYFGGQFVRERPATFEKGTSLHFRLSLETVRFGS